MSYFCRASVTEEVKLKSFCLYEVFSYCQQFGKVQNIWYTLFSFFKTYFIETYQLKFLHKSLNRQLSSHQSPYFNKNLAIFSLHPKPDGLELLKKAIGNKFCKKKEQTSFTPKLLTGVDFSNYEWTNFNNWKIIHKKINKRFDACRGNLLARR